MDEDKLQINEAFAERYIKRKEREEKSRLKEKYGDVALHSSSESSSEEEDEDADAWTSDMERGFLRTLAMIKKKDPSIYDATSSFYAEPSKGEKKTNVEGARRTVKKEPVPVHLKDFERQQLLEKGSMAGVSDSEEEEEGEEECTRGGDTTYIQEQEQLRTSFKEAADLTEDQEEEDSSSMGGLLVLRRKTQEEKDKEEEDYVHWLKGEGEHIAEEMSRDLAPLRDYWANPSLGEGERFLRDFILNKGYLEDRVEKLPTYHDVVESDSDGVFGKDEAPPSDSEDEEALEEQETFERRFNFRFEEPDADLITSYPRTLGTSVRREDDKRKKKRKERTEKKAQEAEERKEELRRLRNLQQKEVKEKLERLSRITGNTVESFGLSAEDLEGDFDPEDYDGVMQKVFSKDYYDHGEEVEDEKPQFSDLEGEDWNYGDQEDFNMDADYNAEVEEEEEETSKRKRKKRRRRQWEEEGEESRDAELLAKYKHEGYLKGELFRYRPVEPNDFGLSTEEILWSDNKELNRWASLTKAVQYLTPEEELKEKKKYEKKARNLQKKKAVLTSCYNDDEDENMSGSASKKKKNNEHDEKNDATATGGSDIKKKDKHARNKRKTKTKNVSDSRLKSYGL